MSRAEVIVAAVAASGTAGPAATAAAGPAGVAHRGPATVLISSPIPGISMLTLSPGSR